MRLRSIFDLLDTPAGFDTKFLPSSHDAGTDSDEEAANTTAMTILPEMPATVAEDGFANGSEGVSTTASFALLDVSTDQGHQATDPIETSSLDIIRGSGSIDVIGSPIQETSSGPAIGLHIAPPVDGDFTATTDALFALAASAPTPIASINLANLTPMSFGHGAEAAIGFGAAEMAAAHPTSSLDLTPTSGGAISAGLATLENGAAITNAGVGTAAATAAQVKEALDESSGLIVNGSGIKVGVLSDSFNDLGGAAADEADGALPSASNIQILSGPLLGWHRRRPRDDADHPRHRARREPRVLHRRQQRAGFCQRHPGARRRGRKVICDDVTYFDEPFFQNGIVAQAIQTVEAEGVTFVTSAGNDASNAYQAAWTPGTGSLPDGFTFNDAEMFGSSIFQTINVTASKADPVPLLLEWNLPYGQANADAGQGPAIDMWVIQNGNVIAQETNGTISGESNNPFTEFQFTASGTYQIVITNNFGPHIRPNQRNHRR